MRRVVVLGLLLLGMHLIRPLGTPGFGSQALLAFGFLILGAYAAGELAVSFGMPKLVGYLLSGALFGPWSLNTVAADSVAALTPVSTLAIALIAFLAGAELRLEEVKARGAVVLRILSAELIVTFVAITVVLVALGSRVPFLANSEPRVVFAFSLLFASIAVVHSPAVAMAMLSETRARGRVARTSLGVVLLSDVVIVLLLTLTLMAVKVMVPPNVPGASSLSVMLVLWEIGGAVLVGGAIGALVAVYLKFVRRELFLVAILIASLGSEVARLTHVEPLLTLIMAGFVAENISAPAHGAALRHAMERAAAPVFVVFFALAGAQIVLPDLLVLWPLVLPLALVRGFAIWGGCRVGVRMSRLAPDESVVLQKHLWTALIPQAGVAIGLAAAVANTYPIRGGQIRTLFLALVAVNQLAGPVLFRRALVRSGEVEPETAPSESLSAA